MAESQHITQSSILEDDEYFFISSEGFKQMVDKKVNMNESKNVLWTIDYTYELPIRMKKKGPGLFLI